MVSIGKRNANLLNLLGYEAMDEQSTAQVNGSAESDSSTQHLMDLSDKLVDPYLLRRYGKYLICLARENLKDGSVVL